MAGVTMSTENLTPHSVVEMDLDFLGPVTTDEVEAAIRALGEPSEPEKDAHSHLSDLQRLSLRWGWVIEAQGSYPVVNGVYGDWTWVEEDERLWPALAPFIRDGSHFVFEVCDRSPSGNAIPRDTYEAWTFDGGEVARKSATPAEGFEW